MDAVVREKFIKDYTKLAVCRSRKDGVHDFENLVICEPKTMKERIKANFHNGFESVLVCGVMVVGLALPSLNAAFFIVLTQNMFLSSTMAPKNRLATGRVFMWINLVILGLFAYYKWQFVKKFNLGSLDKTITFGN